MFDKVNLLRNIVEFLRKTLNLQKVDKLNPYEGFPQSDDFHSVTVKNMALLFVMQRLHFKRKTNMEI